MSYDRGAVVWSDDPFKDDPDAGRPWLVLNTDAHPFAEEQYVAVALSTSGYDDAHPVGTDDWVEGGVPRQSYVLPWAVHSPQSEFVEHYQGRLTDEFVDSVVTELVSYVGFDG